MVYFFTGKMTYSGCEHSWTFITQEFELPATLATFRKLVSKTSHCFFIDQRTQWISFLFIVNKKTTIKGRLRKKMWSFIVVRGQRLRPFFSFLMSAHFGTIT